MVTPFGVVRRPDLEVRKQKGGCERGRLRPPQRFIDILGYSADRQVVVLHGCSSWNLLQFGDLQTGQGKNGMEQRRVIESDDWKRIWRMS